MASPASVAGATTAYAESVVAGRTVAGPYVRMACERHLRDLGDGGARGLHFDAQAAADAIVFFGMLCLAEGEFAGKPFRLEPFQGFIVGSLFGWKDEHGHRRFRKAYIEIGKGNGKSPLAAGIGLYGLVADREAGAEIYSAATTRDQAGILWNDAKHMVEASPTLAKRVTVNAHNLAVLGSRSYFRPVSSEARSLDGKRVHFALIDEVHEHPSAMVVDKMQAGTKGRRQPLIFEITNSGYDRLSVCYAHHDYSTRILERILDDDGWFAYVCALDKDDDWTNEAVWPKANPNIDVSVTRTYLREQVREAVGMPSKQNIVKRLNFCIWTEQASRWLDMAAWDACNEDVDPVDREGKPCWAGLDLSSTTDITALTLLFEDYAVLPFFWVPRDGMARRAQRDSVPYPLWAEQGLIEATEGNVVDYDVIRERIKGLAERYDIREIAVDRWNSTQLQTQLQGDGFEIVPFGQGFYQMSAPTKMLEKIVLDRSLKHGGHAVLRWMASNVAVEQDAAGNIKPAKDKSTERIDGIVSLVMSLDRLNRNTSETSVYDERGLLVL